MQFIKRYKARRAKRKEIKALCKAMVSARIRMSSSTSYPEFDKWQNELKEIRDKLYKLQTTACKL